MTKTRKQRGCGIIGDIGDFLKSHKVLSKAGKMLTPLASAWNPGAGVAVAGVAASLDQAGWGKQKNKNIYRSVPVVSASYGRILI